MVGFGRHRSYQGKPPNTRSLLRTIGVLGAGNVEPGITKRRVKLLRGLAHEVDHVGLDLWDARVLQCQAERSSELQFWESPT